MRQSVAQHYNSYIYSAVLQYNHLKTTKLCQSNGTVTRTDAAFNSVQRLVRFSTICQTFFDAVISHGSRVLSKVCLTHPVTSMPVRCQHADEDQGHEDPLDGQHGGPE